MSLHLLVIGGGSIGMRHARVAATLGAEVAMVTARLDIDGLRFASLDAAAIFAADVVVIANETGKHHGTLTSVLARWPSAKLLIEKPLFAEPLALPLTMTMTTKAYVGYCLRFHPAVQALVERTAQRRLFSIQATVGQHLSMWRPDRDYRSTYSARAGEGGALRDLSHELDLVQLVGARWRRVAALLGQVTDLEVACDDVASLLLQTERCPNVVVHLDLVDRSPRRSLVVHAEDMTIEADLIAHTLTIDGQIEQLEVPRDALFERQLQAVVDGDERWLCRLGSAVDVLHLIAAAERAAGASTWEQRAT